MDTAAAAGRPGSVERLPEADGWKSRNEPEFVQWTKTGQTITGVLAAVEPCTIKGKPATEIIIEDKNGRLFKFHKTAHMRHRLEPGFVGQEIRVRYVGDDPDAGTAENAMQLFDIQFR